MDITNRRKESTDLLAAIEWLRAHVDCTGPLAHLPTSDPAVRIICNAIRHLSKSRKAVL